MQTKQNQRCSISYTKPKISQSIGCKMKEGIINFGTNVAFNFNQKVSFFKNFFQHHHKNNIWILGKNIQGDKNGEKQLDKCLKSFIWFSYRKLPGLTKQISSDSGWGCLIRVGQMALAAGLKKYFQTTKKNANQNQIRYSIITPFLQNGGKQQKYSLKKIVQYATINYDKKYGQWFNVSQICSTLTYLHTNSPMKGAQNLEIITFTGGIIYRSQIVSKFEKKTKNIESCITKNNFFNNLNKGFFKKSAFSLSLGGISPTQPSYNSNLLAGTIIPKQPVDKKLLVFVGCQLGYDSIPQKQYQQLLNLLSIQCSLGIIGGIPKKGLYFVGYQNQDLICLDPHYVQQQATFINLKKIQKTFQWKQKRKHSRNKIDPSLAFVFYLDGIQSLKILQEIIQKFSQEYQNPILSIQDINIYKAQNQRTQKIYQRVNQNHTWNYHQNLAENSFADGM